MAERITQAGSCADTSLKSFFSRGEWWLFGLLILTGLALRWIGLDWRPFHHDESLHGMYGKYFFDFPDQNFYRYQALLHGPFLYNMLRVVYNTLGQSNWAARAPIALVGSLLIFAPLLFRKYFTPTAVLVLTAAVALSPTLVYWSRFLREDTLIIGCMIACLYAVTSAAPARKALFFLVFLTLQFCIKENAYVLVAILLGYLIFEGLFCVLLLKEGDVLVVKLRDFLAVQWFSVANALALAAFVYIYLYSAGFRYREGVLDGLYRQSLVYWMHQHSIDRIAGPYLFHFYTLSWYETFFVAAFFVYLWNFYRSASLPFKVLGGCISALALLLSLYISGQQISQFEILNLLKLKDALDVFAFCIFVPQSVIATVRHLLDRNRQLAFFGYLFLAHLATYSYLGEKVPWLTTYPFITGLIYLALYFQNEWGNRLFGDNGSIAFWKLLSGLGVASIILGGLFVLDEGNPDALVWVWFGLAFVVTAVVFEKSGMLGHMSIKKALFTAFCLVTLRAAILTNFVYAGDSREYISQVHTTQEFHDISLKLREEVALQMGGYKPKILSIGDSTWPMTWYMRDVPEYRFTAQPQEYTKFDYIIQNWSEQSAPAPAAFRYQRINLRGWWVPDLRQMTLRKFLAYALNHTPWSPVGYSYVWFQVNPNSPAQ